MSEAKVRGTVHVVEETKTYGQKGFQKRLVVLERDEGRFTNYIPLEFVRDGCQQADDLNVGDEIEATYRLNGRKWQKDPQSDVRYFLSAEVVDFDVIARVGEKQSAAAASDEAWGEDASEESDDVPF
jgi:hypothetical protein